jgi:hypothetical protein
MTEQLLPIIPIAPLRLRPFLSSLPVARQIIRTFILAIQQTMGTGFLTTKNTFAGIIFCMNGAFGGTTEGHRHQKL